MPRNLIGLFYCQCTDSSWGIGARWNTGDETIFDQVYDSETEVIVAYLKLIDNIRRLYKEKGIDLPDIRS